jgi:hypothetical protein
MLMHRAMRLETKPDVKGKPSCVALSTTRRLPCQQRLHQQAADACRRASGATMTMPTVAQSSP